MIKQILFDCGGVLTELNFRQLMEEISGSKEVAQCLIESLWGPGAPWLDYDKGNINSEQIGPAMREHMPAQYHPYLEVFLQRWLEALPQMEGMEEIVDDLHAAGYPCYLLSNFSEGFQLMPERTPVLRKLDGMVISYEIHMLKPDPEVYRYTARTLGFELGETLFIDDNAHNIESAIETGLAGYQFTTPAALREFLRQQNILP